MPRHIQSLALLLAASLALFPAAVSAAHHHRLARHHKAGTGSMKQVEVQPLPPAQDATPEELAKVPSDASALGGYNLLIADRGNNRLVLVSPAKDILWQYDFANLAPGNGADDSFFSPDKTKIIATMEYQHVIQIIDFKTKDVVWTYGEMGKPGAKDGQLNRPDDAYILPDGNVIVADIRNCRVLEIAPDKHVVRQFGETGHCDSKPGHAAVPNGDTPLPNGHVLISAIASRKVMELDADWHPIAEINLPVRYPSDPQPTQDGNFIIADYFYPGKVIIFDHNGQVLWDYDAKDAGLLRQPSLAEELPNGNVLINDDFNHRVIVVDRASKKILWQYGITGRRGSGKGFLAIPDGMDIIKAQ